MKNSKLPLKSNLAAAYQRYKKAATDRAASQQRKWSATRAFLKLVLEYHNVSGHSAFEKMMRSLLKLSSNSMVNEYLAAARFANTKLPTGPARSLLDLRDFPQKLSVSQMAKAHSFLQSKDPSRQNAGKEFLAMAASRKAMPSIGKMKQAVNSRRFTYSLTKLALAPDTVLRIIAEFLSVLSAGGDKSASSCLRDLSEAVTAGGNVEFEFTGIYKTKIQSHSLVKTDSKSPSILESASALPTASVEYRERSKSAGVSISDQIREEGRQEKEQIRANRAALVDLVSGGAPGQILTGQGNREEMLEWIRTGWEGDLDTSFQFADIVAANIYDAEKQTKESLKILGTALREKRIGILIFPREPVGWVEERFLAETNVRNALHLADSSVAINIAETAKKLHSLFPRATAVGTENAVKEALFALRRKLKREPGQKEVLAMAQSELGLGIQPGNCAANLGAVVDKLRVLYPHLPSTTANAKAANACKKLRDKYGIEPDVDTILREARKTIERG